MADAAEPAGSAAAGELPPRPVYLLAGFGARVRAYVIDGLLVLIPTFGLWALFLPPLVRGAVDDPRLHDDLIAIDPHTGAGPYGRLLLWVFVIVLVATACYWLVLAIYSGAFMSRTAGQTPGKAAVGIRVMRADGRPIGFWWAVWRSVIVREVLFWFGAVLTGGLLVVAQYLWPLWDDQRRALHDFVARSRVVQDADGRR